MLVSHRGIEVPDLGVTLMDHSALHSTFRLVLQDRRGIVVDDALFAASLPRRLDPTRANAIVALSGPVWLRTGAARRLVPGEIAIERRDAGWCLRQEPDSVVLILDWGRGPLGDLPGRTGIVGTLPPEDLDALREAAARFTNRAASAAEVRPCVARALSLLRAGGAPLLPVEAADLEEAVDPAAEAVSQALDSVVALLPNSPAGVDLEALLGWSPRHIQRRLAEYHAQHAYNAKGGIRDLLVRWRAFAGAALMSTPGATTAGVAALLGYGSASAFCRAFDQLGLPSPGSVPERLRELAP